MPLLIIRADSHPRAEADFSIVLFGQYQTCSLHSKKETLTQTLNIEIIENSILPSWLNSLKYSFIEMTMVNEYTYTRGCIHYTWLSVCMPIRPLCFLSVLDERAH